MRWLAAICLPFLLLMHALPGLGQGQVLKGLVVDGETNLPLEGVTVQVKGTSLNATTKKDGSFSFSLTPQQADGTLNVSYVGYQPQSTRIGGRTSITIQLEPLKQELQSVTINGYQRPKRKEEVVGAISSITAKELQVDRAIESFDKMLEGLVAGVQVETNTEPGGTPKINIRGQNALTEVFGSNRRGLTTSSQPLFIIDGVPIQEMRKGDEPIAFGAEEFQNPLNGVNPDDIESISVLKDAAAASVYGANANNGVVIITTKKGKSGKAKFGVSFNSGISNPINRLKWLNGPQYHELAKELYLNEGIAPATAEALAGSKEISTDWFGITNRTGRYQNYDMELSGGSENSTYRVSASFLNQEAIQAGNDFQKGYFRIRLDNQLSKKVSLSTSLAPTFTRRNALNIYSELTPIVPNIPVYNADTTYYTIVGVPNPIAVLNQNTNYSEGGTLNGNVRLDVQLLKNLRVSGNLGTDILSNKQNLYESALNETGRTQGGFAQIIDRTSFAWIGFAQANWSPRIGDDHKFDILAGAEMQSQSTKLLRGYGTGFTYYRLNELSNAARQGSASSRQQTNATSFYLQAAYNLKDRYNLNISGRQDASSIFGTDVNTTLNGAVGAGWTISKEPWFANVKWIGLLRLRASYGTTGNSRIGSYEARGLYNIGSSGYNGQASSDPVSLPNPNLGWEKGYKTNVGVDFNFLKRFRIAFDVYSNITDDAISSVNIPYELGFADMLANTSKMQNSGWDASLNAQILKGKVVWNATLNAGYNQNKVLEVKNGGQRDGTSDLAVALRPGASTGAIWGFQWAGVDPQTGVEQFYNKEGKIIRADDRTQDLFSMANASVIGNRLPELQGGFIQDVTYKGLTLTLTITYVWGSERFINYRNEWNGNNLDNRNQSVNMMDRWQKPGDITHIPKLNRQARSGIRFVPNSSRFVYDETHIKLANLGLSYVLPASWAKAIKASRMSVFANGSNLFYWYRQEAPEGRNGIKEYRFSFPEAQSFTGGLKINW